MVLWLKALPPEDILDLPKNVRESANATGIDPYPPVWQETVLGPIPKMDSRVRAAASAIQDLWCRHP